MKGQAMQNANQQHQDMNRQRHQLLIAKVMGSGLSKGHDSSNKSEGSKSLDMSWGNASGETAMSSSEFSVNSIESYTRTGSSNIIYEIESAISKKVVRIQTQKTVIETYRNQAKLAYISRNKPGAIASFRMSLSAQEKLWRLRAIHNRLRSFLNVTKEQKEKLDIEDQRETIQKILDSDFSSRRTVEMDDAAVLKAIQELIVGE